MNINELNDFFVRVKARDEELKKEIYGKMDGIYAERPSEKEDC